MDSLIILVILVSLHFYSLKMLKIIYIALMCPTFWSLNTETFFFDNSKIGLANDDQQ